MGAALVNEQPGQLRTQLRREPGLRATSTDEPLDSLSLGRQEIENTLFTKRELKCVGGALYITCRPANKIQFPGDVKVRCSCRSCAVITADGRHGEGGRAGG